MLFAAKTSLSCIVPQAEQVHSLSANVNLLLITPQLHILDDGSNRPIFRRFTPYHSHLYVSNSTNFDQLTSLMAWAKQWFFSIFCTAKSSIQTVWFSLTILVASLCKKIQSLVSNLPQHADEPLLPKLAVTPLAAFHFAREAFLQSFQFVQ